MLDYFQLHTYLPIAATSVVFFLQLAAGVVSTFLIACISCLKFPTGQSRNMTTGKFDGKPGDKPLV